MTNCFECPRCLGKGEIAAYRNVQNGVCFRCGGKGTVPTRPAKPSVKWVCDFANGQHVGYVKAKTEAEALRKARAMINPAYPAYRGVTPDMVKVSEWEPE